MPNLIELMEQDGHKLVRKGKDYFLSCPFHNEQTPSCSLFIGSKDRWVFHCFGCGASGTEIDYLTKHRKLTMRAAFELMGDEIQNHYWQKKPAPQERSDFLRREREHIEAMAQTWAADQAEIMMEDVAFSTHPYLARKGFPNKRWTVAEKVEIKANPFRKKYHEPFIAENLLLVPIRDAQRKIISMQTIDEDGKKRFIPGGRVKGGAYYLGARSSTRWIVEGFATALSVSEALRQIQPRNSLVIVAFMASNIGYLARPGDRIVADHDASGTGEKFARKTGCRWAMPAIIGDANDLHAAEGIDAVCDLLRPIL